MKSGGEIAGAKAKKSHENPSHDHGLAVDEASPRVDPTHAATFHLHAASARTRKRTEGTPRAEDGGGIKAGVRPGATAEASPVQTQRHLLSPEGLATSSWVAGESAGFDQKNMIGILLQKYAETSRVASEPPASASFTEGSDPFQPCQLAVEKEAVWDNESIHTNSNGTSVVTAVAQQTKSDTVVIRELSEEDVLFGRGRTHLDHLGNRRMQLLVDIHQDSYDQAGRDDKTEMTRRIVKIIQSKGGRFLKLAEKSQDGWVEVPDEKARGKVSHAMRDGRKKPFGAIGIGEISDLLMNSERRRRDAAHMSSLRQQVAQNNAFGVKEAEILESLLSSSSPLHAKEERDHTIATALKPPAGK
jgi:hypothetical protein